VRLSNDRMIEIVLMYYFSGIGPAEHLKSLDIPIFNDLPGVGSHLVTLLSLFSDDSSSHIGAARPSRRAPYL
jgi:hypothetical protein